MLNTSELLVTKVILNKEMSLTLKDIAEAYGPGARLNRRIETNSSEGDSFETFPLLDYILSIYENYISLVANKRTLLTHMTGPINTPMEIIRLNERDRLKTNYSMGSIGGKYGGSSDAVEEKLYPLPMTSSKSFQFPVPNDNKPPSPRHHRSQSHHISPSKASSSLRENTQTSLASNGKSALPNLREEVEGEAVSPSPPPLNPINRSASIQANNPTSQSPKATVQKSSITVEVERRGGLKAKELLKIGLMLILKEIVFEAKLENALANETADSVDQISRLGVFPGLIRLFLSTKGDQAHKKIEFPEADATVEEGSLRNREFVKETSRAGLDATYLEEFSRNTTFTNLNNNENTGVDYSNSNTGGAAEKRSVTPTRVENDRLETSIFSAGQPASTTYRLSEKDEVLGDHRDKSMTILNELVPESLRESKATSPIELSKRTSKRESKRTSNSVKRVTEEGSDALNDKKRTLTSGHASSMMVMEEGLVIESQEDHTFVLTDIQAQSQTYSTKQGRRRSGYHRDRAMQTHHNLSSDQILMKGDEREEKRERVSEQIQDDLIKMIVKRQYAEVVDYLYVYEKKRKVNTRPDMSERELLKRFTAKIQQFRKQKRKDYINNTGVNHDRVQEVKPVRVPPPLPAVFDKEAMFMPEPMPRGPMFPQIGMLTPLVDIHSFQGAFFPTVKNTKLRHHPHNKRDRTDQNSIKQLSKSLNQRPSIKKPPTALQYTHTHITHIYISLCKQLQI
eukprot:TRINITY_DN1219_c0_g2_i1.p1 TRINITY_DN1219_c0_g2~~TRINITY_DN1219_c0_g2_i1.p1  ORF type:complete len:739 (-),score=106.19 TRINITY_DN1219_c0_g2_i1:229-2445(-)